MKNHVPPKILGISALAIVLLVLGIALGQTVVITAPCSTTTSTIGQNVTLTGTCTGTFIISSSSSSTIQNAELIGHAYNQNCAEINIPTSVTYFQTNFSSVNRTWDIYTQIHDFIHNYTLLAGFTTIHGNHNFTETFITPSMTMSAQIPIFPGNGATTFGQQRPLNSNVIAGDNIDVYADADSLQMIWYINNTQGIENEINMPAYPVNNFIPADIASYFTGQINGLHTIRQVGNQFQTPQSPLEVPISSSYHSPCGDSPVIFSNVTNTFPPNNTINNGTMIIEQSAA